jgi:Leucine-rich repeat (LRR) protein
MAADNTNSPFYAPWPMREAGSGKPVVELGYYRGMQRLELMCTQLARRPAEQRKIVAEWCEFFRRPSPVRQLSLVSRVPVPLFEAVCESRQLTELFIKWGPIKDLNPISNLTNLTRLHLGSCSVTNLAPITALTKLEHLSLGNLDRLSDYSPLSALVNLKLLHIEGQPFLPKDVWIDDLKFLHSLKKLEGLSIYSARFRDRNFHETLHGLKTLKYLELPGLVRDESVRRGIESNLPRLQYVLW